MAVWEAAGGCKAGEFSLVARRAGSGAGLKSGCSAGGGKLPLLRTKDLGEDTMPDEEAGMWKEECACSCGLWAGGGAAGDGARAEYDGAGE
jgi:hypothetical protein